MSAEKYRDLKTLMFAKRITQTQMAKELNISQPTLNAKLNGRSDFYVPEAERIIEILEISDPAPIFFKSMLRDTK